MDCSKLKKVVMYRFLFRVDVYRSRYKREGKGRGGRGDAWNYRGRSRAYQIVSCVVLHYVLWTEVCTKGVMLCANNAAFSGIGNRERSRRT